MGKFSKIFHHIESKDLRNKHEQKKAAKIEEEKKKKEFKQYLVSTMETKKYNWREGMTTSDVSTINIQKAPGDGTVTAVDTIDASSYITTVTGVFTPGDSYDGNTGSQIRNSGSGSGQDGGFALGQQYLSFQGEGYNETGHAIRWAGLSAIDSTEVDTLEINAIVGNDSNGGEDPDEVGEELYVMYKTPEMNQFRFLIVKPDGSFPPGKDGSSTDDVIIPIGASGNSGLNKYSVEIPDFARAKGTEFMLIQLASSGIGFDNYGITEINFQRRTPLTVVVPLDNPEASSFIRSAPPKSTSTPKKRKKAVDDKLQASDDYTASRFGDDFPGREVRVGGEDPFASAKIGDDVEPSPQSRDEVKKAFGATQLKTALGKPTTSQPADPIAKVTGIVKGKDSTTGVDKNKKSSGIVTLEPTTLANKFNVPSSVGAEIGASQGSQSTKTSVNKLVKNGTFDKIDSILTPEGVSTNNSNLSSVVASVESELGTEVANFVQNLATISADEIKSNQEKVKNDEALIDPQRSDFPFTRSGAEQYKAAMKYSEVASPTSKIATAGKVYLNYLIGNLPDVIDNEYLGDKFVNSAFEDAYINDKGTITVGDAVIGSGGEMKFDSSTGELILPFNYDFDTNEEQIMKDPDKYDATKVLPAAGMVAAWILGGKYGLDSVPIPFAGYATWISKKLGIGGEHRPGEIRMSAEKLKSVNPQLYNQLFNSKGEWQGEDPYSEENYIKNLPSWFTFGYRTDDGRIFGSNYMGAFGELKPANGLAPGEIYTGQPESGYGTRGFDPKTRTGGTSWTMDYDARPEDTSKASVDPNTPPDPDLALASILGVEKPDKDLAGFKKDAAEKKTEVAVSTEARNSVKSSAEISEMMKGMTAEQKKAAIEKMYPEKAQEILDAADDNVITSALEQGISAVIVDSLADITQPLLGAKTSANAFNEYNNFLGKVAKNPNTPGATYENPINMSNQITKGDMNDLTTTINSGNYQSIVNSIRATNDEDAQKRLKKELEAMISDTIGNNFGLDNFMHNNVKVNLPHLLETGKTKLTKGYKFTTGGSIEGVENATSWDDGWFYGAKLISDALGLEYDTLGTGKVPFPQTFNVGGIDFAPGNIINIPVWTATTFGPAIIAKLGLTNTKNFGGSSYKSPMMYYEVDVPGKYSVDKKGNPIQSEKPSAAEQIKKTVSNVLNQGKEVVSNLFSFGAEDENAPQREDFPMGRSGAKKYSDAMKLYNAAKSFSANNINVEPQLDLNVSDLPVIPPSDENAALIAAAKSGGDAEMDALAKAHAEMMTKHTEAMAKAEAEGASPESLSALSVRQYLARKPLEDALELDSPVPPMPSEPIEPQREDYPNTRSGAKQYQDAMKAFESDQASKEIAELSNEDAETRVFDIYEQDPDVFTSLYDPLFENDPVYKEYMGIYDEMERNATPAGQELLKQQYEALEFAFQGYATEFVDNVLVQPGQMNPFGYENTSNQALTYAGKKDAPAGVYFFDMSETEQLMEAGIDMKKYNDATSLQNVLYGEITGTGDEYIRQALDNEQKWIDSQPEMEIALKDERNTMSDYQRFDNISKTAWARYESWADKYAGREFTLWTDGQKAQYERIKARGEELYKEYEEAENKSYDNMVKMLDATRKRGDLYTQLKKRIDDSNQFLVDASDKRIAYGENIQNEVKSKMDAILSKINGDYDYNEDLRALDPQIEELFNRINKQFLNLYNNRDDILAEPEEGPEFDPFKDELKPNLGAEDGDELALFGKKPPNPNEKQGRGTHMNIINYYNSGGSMGTKPEGWTEQDVQNYIDKFVSSKPQASSDPRTAYAGTGDDAATFSFDGGTSVASQPNYDLYNWMLKNGLGMPAAEWKLNNPDKPDSSNPHLRPGVYIPKAVKPGKTPMVAHFVPRGKNLSEVMLVKKTKLQRPKQFFKEPNQFFNVNDIKPEFPENPPPKLDPNTGMHPEYGKKAKRYGKLDPISANSMPLTGDPEIDAVVNKQKTINKIKKMARNK